MCTYVVWAGINDICNSQSASIHELDAGARRSKRRNNTDWIWLQACLGQSPSGHVRYGM